MTEDEIVAALDALEDDDLEIVHSKADQLLCQAAPKAVAEAWERAYDRLEWWYA